MVKSKRIEKLGVVLAELSSVIKDMDPRTEQSLADQLQNALNVVDRVRVEIQDREKAKAVKGGLK